MIVSRTGRYSDLKIREPKHSFPVTYPDIFRLRDQNTQYGIFPSSRILNLCSRTILYDSAYKCICEILKKTLPFCYCPQPWIVQLHITDDSRMKDVLQLTTEIIVASSTKKKLKKLKNIQKVVF